MPVRCKVSSLGNRFQKRIHWRRCADLRIKYSPTHIGDVFIMDNGCPNSCESVKIGALFHADFGVADAYVWIEDLIL